MDILALSYSGRHRLPSLLVHKPMPSALDRDWFGSGDLFHYCIELDSDWFLHQTEYAVIFAWIQFANKIIFMTSPHHDNNIHHYRTWGSHWIDTLHICKIPEGFPQKLLLFWSIVLRVPLRPWTSDKTRSRSSLVSSFSFIATSYLCLSCCSVGS